MRPSVPFLTTALLGALLVGTVAVRLSARVEDLRDSPLVPEYAGWALTAIPLARVPGQPIQRLDLYPADVAAVLRRQELDVAFATYEKRIPITGGTLTVAGCIFSVPPHTTVEDNSLLPFVRTPQCPEVTQSVTGIMALTMWVPSGNQLAVWTSRPPSAVSGGGLIFVGGPGDQVTLRPVLRGRAVDLRAASRVRRVHLLNYMWRFSPYPYWIGGVLAVAGLLFSAGALLVFRACASQASVAIGLGAAGVALSLGLLYAVLVPPFQGPDEPDHFLAFAEMADRPDLSSSAAELSRIGHFERIKFHLDERFRPADVGRPYPEAWDSDIFPMPISGRSRTTQALWWCASKMTHGVDAPGTLLWLRLVNAVVFALAMGAAVAILAAHGGGSGAFTVGIGLLLIPTLPFFGVHVSEFAALTSTYLVFACVLAALFLDGPSTHRLGLPLGLLTALMVSGGRSAAPMLALVAAALVGRAILGTQGTHSRREAVRRAAIFWLGAAIGASLLMFAAGEAYSRGLWPGDTGRLPGWFRSSAEQVRSRSWVFAFLLPAGIVVELVGWKVRSITREPLRHAGAVAVSGAAYVVAAVIVGLAAASLAIDMPSLGYIGPGSRPPLQEYLRTTLSSLGTLGRLQHHDLLLSTFFWTGFGWLDTLLPIGIVTSLVAVATAMGVWLLLGVARAGNERRGAWLALLAGGWTATVALTATASYFLNRNLHGRYLVGAYLSSLAIVWTAPILWRYAGGGPRNMHWSVLAIPLAACAALHAFALSVILARYF